MVYEESREHGFYALRHAFASSLPAEGVDIPALAEYLGHADLMPSSEDKTRRAVDRVFGDAMVDGSSVPKLFRAGGADAS
jgi:integrase